MLILVFILSIAFPFVLAGALLYADVTLSGKQLSGPRVAPAIRLKRKPKAIAAPETVTETAPMSSTNERVMELVLQVGPKFGHDERDGKLSDIPTILEYATLEYEPVDGNTDYQYIFGCDPCSTGMHATSFDGFGDAVTWLRQHHRQNHVKIKLPEPRRDKKPEPVIDRYTTVSGITDAELAAKVKNNDHAYRTQLWLKDGSVAYLAECNWCGGGWTEKTERGADVQFYIHDCNRTHR